MTFPAAQLPGWYQSVHDWLPIQAGADLLRAGLASQEYDAEFRDLIVVGVWTVLGVGISLRALVQRG